MSLPASAVGASKLAVTAVGAYARIRKQFRVPIAEMGGVQVPPKMHIAVSAYDAVLLNPPPANLFNTDNPNLSRITGSHSSHCS